MSVYTFEKSFLQRLDEIKLILEEGGSSSKTRDQWKEFLEVSIEPAGYTAIWKISKGDCESLNIKYPCEVFGNVTETDFDGFAVCFEVESVQDDNVHLPETCRVPLEDLYPTVEQENSALNVDLTADCLDRYRFFFNYIFFPWDDTDTDFVGNLLLPRMKLFFDLKNKQLSKGLSSHIRAMIAEAKYIETKRENLETSFGELNEDVDISHGECKDKARKLLELHFRMNKIKHEIDVLVNPEMREIFEELKFPHHQLGKKQDRKVFVVTKDGTLSEQVQLINELKNVVPDDAKIHWLSLQDAIAVASTSSEIYIPSGDHSINFLEYLNGDILLSGLTSVNSEVVNDEQDSSRISAGDLGSMLLAVDGNLNMKNLHIDCAKVKTGLLIKGGVVIIKNCFIYGSKDSSVTEAFSISGDSHVIVENCVISGFATAFAVTGREATLSIKNSIIKECNIGVYAQDDAVIVTLEGTSVINCEENGILKNSSQVGNGSHLALDFNEKGVAAK